jgi:Rod binding domain-containing protein
MMKELLAPLSSTQSSLVGDQETGGSSSALTTFAGEALGKALSEHGGFGIASSILRQLTEGNRSGKPAVTASRNETATNSPFQ